MKTVSSAYEHLLTAIKTSTFYCNSRTLRQEIDALRLKQSQWPSVAQPGIIFLHCWRCTCNTFLHYSFYKPVLLRWLNGCLSQGFLSCDLAPGEACPSWLSLDHSRWFFFVIPSFRDATWRFKWTHLRFRWPLNIPTNKHYSFYFIISFFSARALHSVFIQGPACLSHSDGWTMQTSLNNLCVPFCCL